ncbi:hypothetical protein IXO603_20270, partial [Xanthomonas oryzae pv. oryzae]
MLHRHPQALEAGHDGDGRLDRRLRRELSGAPAASAALRQVWRHGSAFFAQRPDQGFRNHVC